MITKPNFLSIMAIKQLLPRMLLVVGLACAGLISIPNLSPAAPVPITPGATTEAVTDGAGHVIGTQTTIFHGSGGSKTLDVTYTAGESNGVHQIINFDAKGNIISAIQTGPDGTRSDTQKDASGNFTRTTTHPDGTIDSVKGDSAGNITSKSSQKTYPNGTVVTATIDPKTDKATAVSIKDAKGNVSNALPDGKGGFTSSVTGKHGQVATTSYDANGKPTGETTKDKHGKVVSSTVYDKDGKVVSQTGQKQKSSLVGIGGQSTGGTQTSQGSGKHKDKENFQAEVVHKPKDKLSVQDSGSSSGSSGSGQQGHHKRH